jgi:hypothetical protein
MGQADPAVRPNAQLHAEMPFVTVLRLVRFRITRPILVLSRGQGKNVAHFADAPRYDTDDLSPAGLENWPENLTSA